MARLAGKVAFITGPAGDRGRAEAVRFAQEGASLIQSDVAAETVSGLPYALGTKEQLVDTISRCGRLGVEVVADAVIHAIRMGCRHWSRQASKNTGVWT